jgi:predicted acyltransferase
MSTAVIPQPDTIQSKPTVLQRVLSVDAYRGFVMLLMMAEVTRIHSLDSYFKDAKVELTGFWKFLHFHQNHVPWRGLSLHDMIQPSFSFLVGTAMVYSLFSRYSKGQSFARAALHALWRSVLLIALGIFLRTQEMFWTSDKARTYFTFEDTLSQIGLGYFFLFLIAHLKPVFQWVAFAAILVGYWLAFFLYPAPGNDYDYAQVGVNQEEMIKSGLLTDDSLAIFVTMKFQKNILKIVQRETIHTGLTTTMAVIKL